MSYKEAPATKLLATHCVMCSRPLLEAASVEAGLGPVCRERVGYNEFIPSAVRQRANQLIHLVSLNRHSEELGSWLGEIKALGLERLSERLGEALAEVKIEEVGGKLYIEAPYLESALGDWRRIKGRFWDRQGRRNVVPVEQRASVWALLRKNYSGVTGKGPRGLFKV